MCIRDRYSALAGALAQLAGKLGQAGLPVTLDSLTVDQCADTICRALGGAEGK